MAEVTFADYLEKRLETTYSQAEKEYLNRIFLNREEMLKPQRKDSKSSRKMILSIFAKDYEEFVFDVMKRKIEEQNAKVLFNSIEQDEDKNH